MQGEHVEVRFATEQEAGNAEDEHERTAQHGPR
jgi:hypothetical protein